MLPDSTGSVYKNGYDDKKLYRIKPLRGQHTFEGFIACNLLEL